MGVKLFTLVFLFLVATSLVAATTDSLYIENYDIQASYSSAIADETFTLTLSVISDTSTTKTLTIDFDDDDPLNMITDQIWNFQIMPGETKTKSFRIEVDEDADSKTYSLDFSLDDQSDKWENEFEIKVVTDKVEFSLGEIISSPKKITPDSKEVELSIKLKNTGDYEAQNLVAELILPKGFTASSSFSDQVHIGDLEPGEAETLTFYFDVDDSLSKKDYIAQLKLKYDSDSDDETETIDINLPVFSIPQFQITSIEILSEGIFRGETSKIKIAIQNIGEETGKEITLKAYERNDQPFTFTEKSEYIGTLNQGEIGYAVFEFETKSDAETIEYLLNFQTRAISGTEVIVDDITTSIYVTKKETSITTYLIISILGLIIMITIAMLMLRRL